METEIKDNKIDFSPIKIETKANVNVDLTETSNMITKDLIESKNKISKNIGGKIGFCWDFLTAKIKPIMYETIRECDYKLKEIDIKLAKKYEKIPDDNRTEPRLSIVGPAIDVLKYNLDEEHIKEMFVNILTGEMDNRKQNKILPAYAEIIKQLSKEDAMLLKSLKQIRKQQLSTCILRLKFDNQEGYIDLDTIIVDSLNHTIKPKKIVLENLERLNIIKLSNNIIFPANEKMVKNAFNYYKSNYFIGDKPPEAKLTYTDGSLIITDFGWNFIDICCS